MKRKLSALTYTRLRRAMRRWAPETFQILRGGLLVTLLLQIGVLLLWDAAVPPRPDIYEMTHTALAMKQLTGVTLGTTLIGALLVERAARRAKNRSERG